MTLNVHLWGEDPMQRQIDLLNTFNNPTKLQGFLFFTFLVKLVLIHFLSRRVQDGRGCVPDGVIGSRESHGTRW
jgi:hypothetical protein